MCRRVPPGQRPHVKARSDTDHSTTNCLSSSLYNSPTAKSNPVQSSPQNGRPLCVVSMRMVITGGQDGDQREAEKEKREHPLHLSVLLGLKAVKPQTLNIYSVVTVVHFERTRQTWQKMTSVSALNKQKRWKR